MLHIWLFGIILLVLYSIPLIICFILLMAIIRLIKTKTISNTFKIIIILIILLFIFILFINIYHERPNDLYLKMKEINDNNSLIGVSKEQVVELLGEPKKRYKNNDKSKEVYKYSAGNVFREIYFLKHTLWTKTYFYVLSINFDETEKVESTLMKYSLELVEP